MHNLFAENSENSKSDHSLPGFHFQIFGWGGNFPSPQGGEFPPLRGGKILTWGGESSAQNSRHFAKVISNKANK